MVGVMMRGTDETSGLLFSYVDLEARIPARHPLRKIQQVVNDALASLDGEFEGLYTDFGRPSIPPEWLIHASLIQILFSVRSERQLMEQMQYNLLFRWFVGLGIDDPVWVPTVFTKNRDRLLTTEMSRKVMAAIRAARLDPMPPPKLKPERLHSRPTPCPARTAMPKSISGVRSGPMPLMPRPPTQMRAFTRNLQTPARRCVSSAMP
jgi:transposase